MIFFCLIAFIVTCIFEQILIEDLLYISLSFRQELNKMGKHSCRWGAFISV